MAAKLETQHKSLRGAHLRPAAPRTTTVERAMLLFALLAAPTLFPNFGMKAKPAAPPVLKGNSAPDWAALKQSITATSTGVRLSNELEDRERGEGGAHTDAKVRLFDAKSEDEIRVTLFRDTAAWCPYCQKVWLMLEEKRIPFKVSKINMRSYGDKPAWL